MAEEAFDKDLRKMNELVEGFRINLRSLRDEQTPEAVIRQEYIDPFWTLLGWDVANSAHRSSAEKDVVIEATVGTVESEQTRSRRPDYIFRIDGFPRFIVEAKKPSIDLEKNKDAIFQAKTYAWSAQIPFVILTNFEQFRLFDATVKPYHSEPDRGIIDEFDLRFEDYTNQWDILQKTFSREAVANGSLEQLLAKIKHVRKGRRIRGIDRLLIDLRGTEPVDWVFLQHLEDFRLRFARALFDENKADFPDPHTHHGAARLTEATQRLIDRLVFIRVCEDRDITPYGELREIVNNSSQNRLDLYPQLTARFRRFDEEYNGYLFKPHFSEQLKVSPELLADFIRSLYPPEGAYRFDAIGDDILGIIYERFLGSVITIQKNHVDAQEKPEVRHAGGVYYTPRFVVNTIIRRVVGPKIKEKSPLEVLNTKILDPACGSGSFLIAALQFLFDHCVRYVSEHPETAEIPASPRAKEKKVKIAFKDNEDSWHLSPKFRSQLLASCMHGVDIDAQAVEVTIMSLYLKLLEGRLPPNWQREFLQSRLLPPLDNNICCGNSLLSQTDFDRYWDNKFGSLFGGDEDLRFRINAFDWNSQTRGFGRLFDEHKGFDCIIGNPPYIRVQELKKWEPEECEFYKAQYKSAAKGSYDIYVVFIERGLQLLASDGFLGFICPHKFWQSTYGKSIRELIAKGKHIFSIIDFTDQQVFRGVITYTAIHIFSKTGLKDNFEFSRFSELSDGESQCRALDNAQKVHGANTFEVVHPTNGEPWFFHHQEYAHFLKKLEHESTPLCPNIAPDIFQGIVTGADDIFLSSSPFIESSKSGMVPFHSDALSSDVLIEKEMLVPVVRRQGFQSYILNADHSLLLTYNHSTGNLIDINILKEKYENTFAYLKNFEQRLKDREDGRFLDCWWGLSRAQNIAKWSNSKILIPYMINRLQSVYDEKGVFFVNVTTGGYGICLKSMANKVANFYVVGLLNSRILDFYLRCKSSHFHGGYFPANKQFIQNLPIKIPKTKTDIERATQISSLVQKVIKTKNKLQKNKLSDRERERHEREIEANESQIDELVCKLYGVDKIPN
jgi:type I restriction-modification system DNA methylase subunit